MADHAGKRMPRSIDEPDQILLWSIDELLPVGILFGLGIVMHQLIGAIVMIVIFLKVYRRFRDGRPNGYLTHLAYWYGLAGPQTATVRNPFIRRFLP